MAHGCHGFFEKPWSAPNSWFVVTGNVDESTMVYGRYNELVFMGIINVL